MLIRWDDKEVIRILKTQYVLQDQNLWVHDDVKNSKMRPLIFGIIAFLIYFRIFLPTSLLDIIVLL